MYSNHELAFRVIEKEDLDILKEIHNDQSVWENLFNIDFVDDKSQEYWLEGLHRKRNDLRFVLCLSEDQNVVVGRVRIQNINLHHNNCEIGLDLHESYRGKGYGLKCYSLVLKFLFDEYNMNVVYLKVADFNSRAKVLYKKLGFKETGSLPSFFYRKGKYWDYCIMSLKKDECRHI